MDKGLFELDSDEEVLTICRLLPKCKYFEVYVVVIRALSQENSIPTVDPQPAHSQPTFPTYC